MRNITKEYTNGELTVVRQPTLCIHSAQCFVGLPSVFDPTQKPWVDARGADTQKIREQIEKRPSGALSFYLNGEENKSEKP